MHYSAVEAVIFGQRMLEAGRIATTRNARKNERWTVGADPDTIFDPYRDILIRC